MVIDHLQHDLDQHYGHHDADHDCHDDRDDGGNKRDERTGWLDG